MIKKWWKEGVVYQIYPRSFNDSNDDGIGDIKGIIEKLDYLKYLGIDIIWLSPFYKSPNKDNGYDISDYYSVMPEFGTMEDVDILINEVHKRGLKIIIDVVYNHTSNKHSWFIESRSAIDNPYRNYYIWRKGKNGGPPTNWGSIFGGPAWEYDKKTDEYYLHLFSKEQPDLNWDNPEVRKYIYKTMEWWLGKGVDGFRMDVISYISKANTFLEGSPLKNSKYTDGSLYYVNGPKLHEYLQEMNKKVTNKHDIMIVGETPGVTAEEAQKYVNFDRNELDMIFHFELMDLDCGQTKWEKKEWQLSEFKKVIKKWYQSLQEKGWNSFYLNNHDQPRMVSRFGDEKKYRVESAKMLATLLLTLPGTPYLYQGEEIGMTNVDFIDIKDYRDLETLNYYKVKIKEGKDEGAVMKAIQRVSRDNARTPMQWDNSKNAGFTNVIPWIKTNPNYRRINVDKSIKDKKSILHYYRRLLCLRKERKCKALIYGNYQPILEDHPQIYAYIRMINNVQILVILNFSAVKTEFSYQPDFEKSELLIASYEVDEDIYQQNIILRPYEARLYYLQ